MSMNFDPYHRWLGIPAKHQPPDHYRLLGVERFEDDQEVIRDAAERQMRHVRSYELGEHGALAHKILNELARAKACLLNAEKQAAYDDQLRQSTRPAAPLTARVETYTGPSFAIGTEQETVRSRTRRKPRRAQPERLWYYVAGGGAATIVLLGVVVLLLVRPSDGPADGGPAVAERTSPQSGDERKDPVAGKPTAKTEGPPPELAVAPFDARQAQSHQSAWAKHLQRSVELTNSIGMQFKLIPAGSFMMGLPESDSNALPNEKPQHRVNISKSFYMGTTEVTGVQYEQVIGKNPNYFTLGNHPAEQVSWDNAVEFCKRLSALPAERSVGRVYRLPTEAEWEYACRAGTTTRCFFGDDTSRIGEYAWYDRNSGRTTHPVGEKKPNPWGLYDMYGNVWEWCQDRYAEYPSGVATDPQGPSSGASLAYRGGSWNRKWQYCYSARRGGHPPSYRYYNLGFRVVSVAK